MKFRRRHWILFSIIFFISAFVILPRTNILPFSSYLWQSGTLYRYSMSKSLVNKVNNSKINRSQIIELLGQPDDSSSSYLHYFLKSNNLIIGLDSYWLSIWFNGSKVVASVGRED
jgi:hypothetical protein